MSTFAIITALIIALCAVAWWWWESRLEVSLGPLKWQKIYEFEYGATFPTQRDALAAVSDTTSLRLDTRINAPDPHQKYWRALWTLRSNARVINRMCGIKEPSK